MDDSSLVDYFVNSITAGRVASNISFAVTSLIVFEYIITFSLEVELFWNRRLSSGSVLFYVHRYFMLLLYISQTPFFWDAVVLRHVSWPTRQFKQSCHALVIIVQLLTALQFVPYAVFSALRAYAFSDRQRLVSLLVLLLALAPFVANMVRYRWLTWAYDEYWGCVASVDSQPASITPPYSYTTRISVILADVIVIALIGRAAYKMRGINKHVPARQTYFTLLFRDGAILFIVQLVLSTIQLVITAQQINTINNGGFGNVSSFIGPITNVLVTRSLLNLQQLNRRIIDPTLTDISLDTRNELDGDLMFKKTVGTTTGTVLDSIPDGAPSKDICLEPIRNRSEFVYPPRREF